MLRLVLLLLLSAIALAVVIPTLGSTADVVAVCVITVAVIGFVIFIWSQGGQRISRRMGQPWPDGLSQRKALSRHR